MDQQSEHLEASVPEEMAGKRFDQVLALLFSDYSRSRIQQWIKKGDATLDGVARLPRYRVTGGEHAIVIATFDIDERLQPQPIELAVVHEDEHILVINKPAGLVVHPGAGNPDGTLVNALIHFDAKLQAIPRAGVVHRLDKDTSGLLVVARTLTAHKVLVEQLKEHQIARGYEAIVHGVMTGGGTIDAPIARHRTQRTRMAVNDTGRPAITHFRVKSRLAFHTHVTLQLQTGRTHQIRVHLTHIGYPIVGDQTYGGRQRVPAGGEQSVIDALRTFKRQALHASRLTLNHPITARALSVCAPLPRDMQALLDTLSRQIPSTT